MIGDHLDGCYEEPEIFDLVINPIDYKHPDL